MSLVVLHHSDVMSIATNKRVVSAQHIGTLETMCEQADTLAARLSAEEARLEQAEEEARIKGYNRGLVDGQAQGTALAAEELTRERGEIEAQKASLEIQATTMAFEIVRRLANTLDPAELLCALAIATVQSHESEGNLVLRVHASQQQAVAEKLSLSSIEGSDRICRVVGDTDIDTTACIVETSSSRIVADLKTQADILESKLVSG